MKQFYNKHEVKISRIAIIAIYLALIRTIGECFRLHYIHGAALTFEQLQPFLVGAMISAIACLAMTISSFYKMNKLVITVALITIVALLTIKIYYAI
ncbi:MAG: hypothetical protein ABI729_04165 [Chitinophagales bacterium]